MDTSGSNDAFLIKYSSAGAVQWTTHLGGVGNDQGFGVITDTSNNVYVATCCSGNLIRAFNSDSNTFLSVVNQNQYQNIFVVKYDSAGTAQSYMSVVGMNNNNFNGQLTTVSSRPIACDRNNNIYLTGYMTGQTGSNSVAKVYNADGLSVLPSSPSSEFIISPVQGFGDIFTIKFNSHLVALILHMVLRLIITTIYTQ
jgi:hypothetical protein